MDTAEIDRLAHAIAVLRPDWPVGSLRAFMTSNLATRPYLDAAVVMSWVACDPKTRTPKRVLESGPWWEALRPTDVKPERPKLSDAETCAGCFRSREGHDKAEALVSEEARHAWISVADRKRQQAVRPDETRGLDHHVPADVPLSQIGRGRAA